MARRRGSTRNRRIFSWARSSGQVTATVASNQTYGAVDLLAGARTDWGNAALRGATVSTVKGYFLSQIAANHKSIGVAGIRVCSYADIGELTTNAQEAPYLLGQYEDWLAYMPYVTNETNNAVGNGTATWNVAANQWAIDVRSQRVMHDLGLTLGLFWFAANFPDTTDSDTVLYDMSVGLKLP